jgi:hypothetical protein
MPVDYSSYKPALNAFDYPTKLNGLIDAVQVDMNGKAPAAGSTAQDFAAKSLTATVGTFSDTTDSSSTSTGAVTFAGGVGIAKKLYVGGNANFAGTVSTGALTVNSTSSIPVAVTGATTSASYCSVSNTGGAFVSGVAGSSGGPVGGGLPYASFVGSNTTTPVQILINGSAVATFDTAGNLLIGASASYAGKVQAFFSGGTNGVYSINSDTADASTTLFAGRAAGSDRFRVYGNGNVVNSLNSYGAISDPDFKTNITLAGSQWNDVLELARNVTKYNLLSDPDGPALLGFITKDRPGIKGVRSISPGLVRENDNFEEVEIEPAQAEVLDEAGEVVIPAKAAVTELRATDVKTDSLAYSVAYMKAFKALGENMERTEILELKSVEQKSIIAALMLRIEALEVK